MSFGKKCTITQYHYKILHHRWHYLIFFDGLFSQDVSYKSSHSLTANNTKCKERPSKINNCHCIYTWRSHFLTTKDSIDRFSSLIPLFLSGNFSMNAHKTRACIFCVPKPTDWNFEVNTNFGTPGKYTTRSVLFSRFSF